jgi:ATP-binding cassette subfamily C protein
VQNVEQRWLADFFGLARWYPREAFAAIALTSAAALLEGLGIAALIPVLQSSLSSAIDLPAPLRLVLPADKTQWMPVGIALFLLLATAALAARLFAELALLSLRARIEERARITMTGAILQMRWSAYVSLRLGDLTQAQFNEGLQMGYGAQLLVQATGAALACLAYIVVAISISPEFTAYTLIFGLLVGMSYAVVGRWVRSVSAQLSSLAVTLGERVTEYFSSVKYIKASGLTAEIRREARELYADWRNAYIRTQTANYLLRHGFEFVGLVFIATFLFISSNEGKLSTAAALVFLGIFYRLAPRLLAVQESIHQCRLCHPWYLAWAARLHAAETSRDTTEGAAVPVLDCQLIFRNVAFSYGGDRQPALSSANFSITKHTTTAVVGPSGGGKTTVIDLLTGVLQPTNGEVLVDGVALRDIDLQRWREMIGLVLQEPHLLHESLFANITWGDTSPNEERARAAAIEAGLGDLIRDLPAGLATSVGERGARLSGGQRQRLAIARALYRKPQILILDEPTSSLDSEAEQEVLATLRSLSGKLTIIIVTHSLQVASICDRRIQVAAGVAGQDIGSQIDAASKA